MSIPELAKLYVKVQLDTADLDSQLKGVEARLARITSKEHKVRLGADVGGAVAGLAQVEAKLNAIASSASRLSIGNTQAMFGGSYMGNAAADAMARRMAMGSQAIGAGGGIGNTQSLFGQSYIGNAAANAQAQALAMASYARPPSWMSRVAGGMSGERFAAGLVGGAGFPLAFLGGEYALGYGAAKLTTESIATAMDYETERARMRAVTGIGRGQAWSLQQRLFGAAYRASVDPSQAFGIGLAGAKAGLTDPNEIVAFAETMAKAQAAMPEISGAELAETFVRMRSSFGPRFSLKGLASGVIGIANATTADPGEIFRYAQRMLGSTTALGMGPGETFALGGLLKDSNLPLEMSTGAMNRMMMRVAQDPERFANAIGMRPTAFRALVNRNPIEALQTAMGRMSTMSSNTETAEFLKQDLGLSNVRDLQTFLNLAKKIGKFLEFVSLANGQIESGQALDWTTEVKAGTTGAAATRFAGASKNVGSWGQIGARGYPQQDSQKFISDGFDVVPPLEDRLVLGQIPLAHAVEPPQVIPDVRPDPLLRVAVHLADPVPVIIPRPIRLRPRVVHRLVDPPHPG